jgi:hypothetical protein
VILPQCLRKAERRGLRQPRHGGVVCISLRRFASADGGSSR